jgi:hypothetical protein
MFPILEGVASIKDEIIHLLPYQSCTYNEGLHKEAVAALLSCLFQHRMKV